MPADQKPVVVTREELYAQVWARPMVQLAAQYGVSGRGLAKICARLSIPCPPRGCWAKKAAGQAVLQHRLPKPHADTVLEVTITPADPEIPSPKQTEHAQQLAVARQSHATLLVPDKLHRPHPIIAAWLADHKRKVQEAKRERDPGRRRYMEPPPLTETDHRRHRFLDALFKSLERLGVAIKDGENQPVYFEVGKERVDFQLREKQKQIRRPLTEEDKRWSWNRDREWVQELQPTGVLLFTIKTHLGGGMPHEWKDYRDRPLEECLPDIVAALSLAGPILTKRRQEREEAEKRRRQEEHERYLERQDREQDQKRWQCFLQLARQCDKAASARRLIVELETRLDDESVHFGTLTAREWLDWCRRWLDRYDPLQQRPAELYEHLANTDSYTSIEEWAWVKATNTFRPYPRS